METNSILICPQYFIENSEFNNLNDMQFFITKVQENLFKIKNDKFLNGYLIKIAPEKFILMFGCFINELDYDSFKVDYNFFFKTDECLEFDDEVIDTDSGIICNNLEYFDCKRTLNVCTWNADGNFIKDELPFIDKKANPKLILLSFKDSDGYDTSISVGLGMFIDKEDITSDYNLL